METPTAAGYAGREPTKPPPWHALVVWDVFFNALTTGLFLVAAIGELAVPTTFAPVAVWAYPLALLLLLIDLTCLVLDLGDPLRFHHMLRVFKPSSPMSLGTWCLTAYSLPLTLLVALDLAGLLALIPIESPIVWWLHRALLVVGLPFAFGSMVYKGVLFSTSSQPGWRDARWLGAYHAASALMLGCAALLAIAVLTGHDRGTEMLRPGFGLLVVLQCLPLALLTLELHPTLVTRYKPRELRMAAVLVLGVGVIVPLVLVLNGGPFLQVITAVIAALVGGWTARHVVVVLPRVEHGGSP